MIRTGADYLAGLQAPREVYVGGEKVVNVLDYAPFRRPIASYAGLYDLKHDPAKQELLTYRDSPDGEVYDVSFLVPTSQEQLIAKGRAFRTFARHTYGCMGRGPEFMGALIAG